MPRDPITKRCLASGIVTAIPGISYKESSSTRSIGQLAGRFQACSLLIAKLAASPVLISLFSSFARLNCPFSGAFSALGGSDGLLQLTTSPRALDAGAKWLSIELHRVITSDHRSLRVHGSSSIKDNMPAKSRFTRLDAFAKTVEDARIRTASGGIVTIVSLIVILWLVWGEWADYRRIVVEPELIVDKSRGIERDRYSFRMRVVKKAQAKYYVGTMQERGWRSI